jgi:hypothetical protein
MDFFERFPNTAVFPGTVVWDDDFKAITYVERAAP